MARLFDENRRRQAEATIRTTREESHKRAAEIDQLLAEHTDSDNLSKELREQLAESRDNSGGGFSAIFYQEYREAGSKWMIEHSVDGPDYIFQVHPLKPPKMGWQTVIYGMIQAMDVVFPKDLQIRYIRPNERYKLQFYTIKVEKLAGIPGWKGAVKRALKGLAAVDAWPAPQPG